MAFAKDEHGLTPRQKRFATLLATKPDVPDYKLAIEAGVPESSASVWAARAKRLKHVQAYYQRITSAAAKSISAERDAIADVAEIQRFLTSVMRGKIGRFLKDDGSVDVARVKRAPGGAIKKFRSRTQRLGGDDSPVIETTAEIELSDPLQAANALISHHQKMGGLDRPQVNVAVISALPTEQRVQVIKAFLSEPADNV